MATKPMLFNTAMVRSILEGRKTVTRRVVKYTANDVYDAACANGLWHETYDPKNPPGDLVALYVKHMKKSPYQSGDILYVREAWKGLCSWVKGVACPRYGYAVKFKDGEEVEFYFDNAERARKWRKYLEKPKGHWQSPYFMPREVARIFLRVTDVRVERLLDPFFTNKTAIFVLQNEGIDIGEHCRQCINHYGSPCCIDHEEDDECGILDDIRGDFSERWDAAIKPENRALYGWAANPWVWVIEFERTSREEAL